MISTTDIINCAPFRLRQPRKLTPYEWTVAEEAVHQGMLAVKPELIMGAGRPLASTLTHAIAAQPDPQWKQSWFGPAPAVNLFPFGCIGSWFAQMSPMGQAQALAAIAQGNLAHQCPAANVNVSWRPEKQSEYAMQKGDTKRPGQAPDACWKTRASTGYFPATGAKLLELFRALGGGQLSPELQQMAEMGGTAFANRSFLVGVALKRDIDLSRVPSSVNTAAEMMQMLDALVEDVVLIWAPFKGTSLRSTLVTGQVDPAALQALVTGLFPESVEEIFQSLPQLLPQLLPGLFPGGTQGFGALANAQLASVALGPLAVPRSAPGQPLKTGLTIVDSPGVILPKDDPKGVDAVDPAGISGPKGVYLALGLLALGGAMWFRGRSTRGRVFR